MLKLDDSLRMMLGRKGHNPPSLGFFLLLLT